MNEKHCWYSKKQEKLCSQMVNYSVCYYLIDGIEQMVSKVFAIKEQKSNWDDSVYLGVGTFSRTVKYYS